MEILGKLKEDGCKYQTVCRGTYGRLRESDKVGTCSYIDSFLFSWHLNLDGANKGSECGKATPKCKVYSLLENAEQISPEFLLEKILVESEEKLGG